MTKATTPEPTYEAKLESVVTDAFTEGRLDVIDDVVAADHSFVDDSIVTADGIDGREELKAMIRSLRTAFSDLELTIENVVVDGSDAALWYTMSGTHDGDWHVAAPDGTELTLAPTNRTIDVSAMLFTAFENDEIVESKLLADELGMLEQLDVVADRVGA